MRHCIGVIIGLAWSAVLLGQQAVPLPVDSALSRWVELSNAVVTGERDATTADQALRPTRVIGRDAIEQNASPTLHELLNRQLNFRVAQDPVLGAAASLNGLGGNNINVLIDGVPLAGRLNGELDLSQVALDNIERIEIINGPMAVEYGTNSLAGTVNLITKSRRQPGSEFEWTSQYETVGSHTNSASFAHQAHGVQWGIEANQTYFDGWSPGDPLVDGFSNFLADSSRIALWNPKLQRNARLHSRLTAGHWVFRPSVQVLSERIENRGAPRAPYGRTAFDDVYSTTRWIPTLQCRSFNDEGTVWNITQSWQRYHRIRAAHLTDLETLAQTPLPSEQDSTRMSVWMSRGTRHVSISERAYGSAGWDARHETIAGGRLVQNEHILFDAAVFATYTWENDAQSHRFGLRKAFNSAFTAPVLPSWNGLWKWGTHRFRLAYAKGFRAPSLKELHFQFVDVNHQLFGNANLRPETSHFWQVHWQKEGSLNFSLRGYSNVVAEQIGLVDQLDGTYQYVNFAGFSSQGIEAQVHATGKQLEWNIGLSAFKAQTDLVKSGEGDESAAPSQAATMEGQAELTWHINPHLQTSIFIKYNGARQRVVQNAEDEMQLVTAPAYTLLDLNALHWQSPSNRLQIALRLKNLLDVTSLANGFDTSGPETHTSGLTPIAWGRSAVVRLTYQWNQNR